MKRVGALVTKGAVSEAEMRSVVTLFVADRDPHLEKHGHALSLLDAGRITGYLNQLRDPKGKLYDPEASLAE